MVFHQSFVTKEPVNVHCLCRTLHLNYAIASALAYILRNAVWSIDCINHYFVTKNTYLNVTWNYRDCVGGAFLCLPLLSELTNNTLWKQRWVHFFALNFECNNRHNKLLLCNSENGDIAWCNKNNSEWGFCVSLKKRTKISIYLKNPKKLFFFFKNKWIVFFERKQVFLNPADFLKLFDKVCISVPIKSVISISKAMKQWWWELKQRPLAQQEWTLTHSTRFTVLLMTQTQHYIWTNLDTVWMATR